MRMEFFGDSYDIVKLFLLGAIAPGAKWVAFPMFTHKVNEDDVVAYETFLSVSVVSRNASTLSDDRVKHLSSLAHHRHIFLDPDTGIRIRPFKGARSIKYAFGPELVALCKQDRERLLLVFDQSVPNGIPDVKREYIARKLEYFCQEGISGFAYISHTCFVVLSGSESTCEAARAHLLASHLPQSRLVG
jgi:hypothetical protein